MRLGKYPPGWDEKKVRRVLKHQTEEEAVNSQKRVKSAFCFFRWPKIWSILAGTGQDRIEIKN